MTNTQTNRPGCPLTKPDLLGRIGEAAHLAGKYGSRALPEKFAPTVWQNHMNTLDQLERTYLLAKEENAAYGVMLLPEFRAAIGLAGRLRALVTASLAPDDPALQGTLAPFLSGSLKRERLADVIETLLTYARDHSESVPLSAYLASLPWEITIAKLRSYDPTVKAAKVAAEREARDRSTAATRTAWVDLKQFVGWSVMEFEPEEEASREEFRRLTAIVRAAREVVAPTPPPAEPAPVANPELVS